jgi:hypothetical protein
MKWCRLGVEGRRRDEEGWGNHGERRKLKWEMRMLEVLPQLIP